MLAAVIRMIALVLALFASLPTVEITFPEPTAIVEEEQEPEIVVDAYEAELMAKTLWGEYRDPSNYEQCAAVCQCIINRVNAGESAGFGNSIESVVTQPNQFHGFSYSNPVQEDLYNIAVDVLKANAIAENSVDSVSFAIPPDYLWFSAENGVNVYRNAYIGGDRIIP